jgi:hypothetical protein
LDEIFESFEAKKAEHVLLIFFGRAEMAGDNGEIFSDRGGRGGLGGGGGLFRGGGGGYGHLRENTVGQGVGKG